MRLTRFFSTPKQRLVVLVVSTGFLTAATAAVWIVGGSWLGLGIGALSLSLVVVVKLLMEITSDIANQREFDKAVDGRLESLEVASRERQHVVDGLLDRVRAVEHVAGQLAQTDEKILGRVRGVETAAGQLAQTDEKILGRVRGVESRLPAPRQSPPGQLRRLTHARAMIAEALEAVEGWTGRVERPFHEGIAGPDEGSDAAHSGGGDAPLVTVVVACFDEVRFVGETIQSVRGQSLDDWECIVVDDASTDGSVAEIRRAIASDDRFRLIEQSENAGVSHARNAGLASALGRYIVFLDADDLLMSESLHDRVETMRSVDDGDIAGVYCGVRIADEGVRLGDLPESETWVARSTFLDFVSSEGECPFGPTSALLRTDITRACGGFAEEDVVAEDWEFWLRIMRSGFYFVPSKLQTVVYRQKPESKSQTNAAAHVQKSYRHIESAHVAAILDDAGGVLASYPFPLPLSHYQVLLTQARRAVQYAAAALLRSDTDAFDAIVASLETGSWSLIHRHIDIERVGTDGFKRAAGLDVTDLPELREDFAPLLSVLDKAVRRATT